MDVLVSALRDENSTSRGDISGQLNFSTRSFCKHGYIILCVLVCEMSRGAKVTLPKLRNKYVHYHSKSFHQHNLITGENFN